MNPIAAVGIVIGLVLIALAVRMLFSGGSPDETAASQMSDADRYEANERSRMPAELQNAKLVISEKTFYRSGPRPFAAKTDQGFLTADGWVVLVETKTRRWTSESDLAQISAQAVAIASSRGNKWKVANWGYIRLAPPGGKPYYLRVPLLHPTRVDQLWDRWKCLKDGRATPIARANPHRCKTCALRSSCKSADLSKV